ncbi:MAG: hypothetical protein JXQ72_02900 [Anaerolineae bacterium]|nr:hypothetical protein [Anaerolineae bacterium]
MQWQRWRWLWIWVGVLVAGCGQLWSSESTPAPTREPTLPLLGYTLLPPTVAPGAWVLQTATPLIAADGSTPFSPVTMRLMIVGPACYNTPVGSLVCLGQVHNTLDDPVEQVTVEVQLVARDGTRLAVGEGLLSRWLLPAGATGPYRVLFESVPEGYAGAVPVVTAGRIAPNNHYADLALRQVSGRFVLNQYQITLSVVNKSALPADHLAVTMLLLNESGQITGFRQVYLDADRRLNPGESLAMTLKVIPQGPNTVGFEAFAEGVLVPR